MWNIYEYTDGDNITTWANLTSIRGNAVDRLMNSSQGIQTQSCPKWISSGDAIWWPLHEETRTIRPETALKLEEIDASIVVNQRSPSVQWGKSLSATIGKSMHISPQKREMEPSEYGENWRTHRIYFDGIVEACQGIAWGLYRSSIVLVLREYACGYRKGRLRHMLISIS